jgi:hypothetical protein
MGSSAHNGAAAKQAVSGRSAISGLKIPYHAPVLKLRKQKTAKQATIAARHGLKFGKHILTVWLIISSSLDEIQSLKS